MATPKEVERVFAAGKETIDAVLGAGAEVVGAGNCPQCGDGVPVTKLGTTPAQVVRQ
jgi:hypothetical protein